MAFILPILPKRVMWTMIRLPEKVEWVLCGVPGRRMGIPENRPVKENLRALTSV